ncbi:photosynthetic complex assembly protein PuhC [Candidatus Thiodictyon syntrophicum]|jgi:putative photosynthetic complex assembly protein|uniref:Photosynthetic complex assembly protein PuhC n=1 Tax=Candidatus Thiodictyon syntrophicum TaxID=1166950 RepID=A0A2K8UIW3_9GAMM|nr:photosynthetic complex assembly protein PuhC [Candidatus Thiodictyon syntrophicum]AUB85429.1 hypothetical protein THSYN_31395 [Candidatus Thiodictyon syntrophicum]
MADPSPNAHFPRKVLIAFAALIGFFLVLVTAAVLTGYNASQMPPSPAVYSRDLRFSDRPDGTTLVQDATDGSTVAVLPVGGEGFVRGLLRTTSRGRRNASVPPETPFRLARLADGRLNLTDLGTQRVIELRSFGPANDAAFAVFLGSKAALVTAPGAPAVKTDATH